MDNMKIFDDMLSVSVNIYKRINYLRTILNDDNFREIEEFIKVYERLWDILHVAESYIVEDDF